MSVKDHMKCPRFRGSGSFSIFCLRSFGRGFGFPNSGVSARRALNEKVLMWYFYIFLGRSWRYWRSRNRGRCWTYCKSPTFYLIVFWGEKSVVFVNIESRLADIVSYRYLNAQTLFRPFQCPSVCYCYCCCVQNVKNKASWCILVTLA